MTTNKNTATTTTTTAKRTPDPEITAIRKVTDALSSLTPTQQERVFRFVASKIHDARTETETLKYPTGIGPTNGIGRAPEGRA